ncbi:hypothetical protein MPH_00110 [Macrophomina phaseolina MS6]|uniref:Zn(2)-C6 fungal-type domain-containing protein n=1 Tax=Macrophomina phaseolina (strain MS6) TaxID=1126212 RepID=K2SC96_MACPH|nr:hypothetical protein MPH_00110 [Macrophomina phaseolina MS6]
MVKGKSTRSTPRLRASCDRCHNAKVKCIYEDERDCIRCRKRDYTCVRSMSMPVGRTPKSKTEPYPSPEEPRSPSSSDAPRSPASPYTFVGDSSATSPETDETTQFGGSMLDFSQPTFFLPEYASSFPSLELAGGGWFGAPPPLYTESPAPPTHSVPSPSSSSSSPIGTPHQTESINTGAATSSLAFQPASSASSHRSTSTTNSTARTCACLDILGRTLRDLQQSPVEGKTLDHVLRLNRALLQVIRDVLACPDASPHPASLDYALYACLNKLLATYHEAVYMGADAAPVRVGSYTVVDRAEDVAALKCRIVLLDVRKIAGVVEEMGARMEREGQEHAGEGGVEAWERRGRELLHRFTRNEAERVARHMCKLSGG